MFATTNIAKNSDKSKYVYSNYGKSLDGAGLWSFGNNFPRNFVKFVVDDSLLSHTDNHKNNFLVLVEGQTDDINGSASKAEEMFSFNFNKTKTKFSWVCIIMVIIVICLLMEKESISLKPI